MKPQTVIARSLSDAELQEHRAHLRREIPLAMSLLDAYDREHRRRRRRSCSLVVRAAIALLVMVPVFAAEAPPVAPAAQSELLLIERAYDGPVERVGVLVNYQYTSGRMLIEWADTTTDGIFRDAFEASP